MSAKSVLRPAKHQLPAVYDWGVQARNDLISTARKVRRDFAGLREPGPDAPAILAALDEILREADRWDDRCVGTIPEKGGCGATLPPGLDLPLKEVAAWADATFTLSVAVNRLGTYCHFALKEQRKAAGSAETVRAPLFPPEQYQDLKRKNSLLNHLEILLGRTSLASYPTRLELDPTNECNLRCRACQHGITKDFHHTELSPAYLDLLAEAFPYAEYAYLFGRGEPTMSATLPRLVRDAARHQVRLDMLTNGTLVERVDLPWDAFHRLGVSIDGACEETMRTLRPVAPLARVLEAVVQMRAKAPQATLYTKVTISRMNFDELPALVEKLADAGVNEVIIHSLDVFHPMHEAIQVRENDRPEMALAVEAARETAARRGMAFSNTMNFDAVARQRDGQRDKAAMVQILKDTPLPVLQIPDLPSVRRQLESAAFTYHPEPLVRAAGLSPRKGPPPAPAADAVRAETLDRAIGGLVAQVRALTAEQVRIPYCFIPWKMPLLGSDGRARACCHLQGHFGDLDQSRTFHDLWSAPDFVRFREAMFQVEHLPDTCARCEAHERSMLSGDTLALADLLAVPIRQAPRYPAPMDVAALLRAPEGVARSRFEVLSSAVESDPGRFVIPPNSQIVARFPNPRTAAGVYYQGRFRISGGRLLVGVKPLWDHDLWHYPLDPEWITPLGEWVGLPMPPLPLDFAACPQEECCLFLWAPPDNGQSVEVAVEDFSGIASAPGPRRGDAVHHGHFWSGVTACD